MNVLHLCHLPLCRDHPDFDRLGHQRHPGRWVLDLALAQASHTDLRPRLLTQVPGATRDHETVVEGIPALYVAAPARGRAATLFWFDVRRIVKRVRAWRPDVVHAHGTEEAYGLAAQASGWPYVITAQGLLFLINPIMRAPPICRERLTQITEWLCLRRARHVIAKSDYVADRLARRFPHLILHRIPNTFDPGLAGIEARREPRTVVFVGTVSPRKGFHLVREAVALVQRKVPDVRLKVVGNNANPASPYERTELDGLRRLLGDRLDLYGRLPQNEAVRVVASSAVLAAPSLEEMFGNQVIEALVVGTPAVVTEGTAMAENVRRFGSGRVVPQGDARALAEAIVTLFSGVSGEEKEATRRRIDAAMGPGIVAERHRDLYREIRPSGVAG